MSSYAGSRATSNTHPSRLGSLLFIKATVTCEIRTGPLLLILAKKLSLTPKKPMAINVTFKTSEDSTFILPADQLRN